MDSSIVSFKFEKLTVWQKSVDYAEDVYKITKRFPTEEKFGLISQLRRSAVSVSLNIAEGSGKTTRKEFRKFLHDAMGSLRESVTILHLAKRLKYIEHASFDNLYAQSIEISKMLYSLANKLSD